MDFPRANPQKPHRAEYRRQVIVALQFALSWLLCAPAAAVDWVPVTAVHSGWVTVTTPELGQIQVGDRFIVHSPGRNRGSAAVVNPAMGMFVVTRVDGTVASGPLPRGTIARVGDSAEPSLAPLFVPKIAPPLWYGMGRFYGTLRPILQHGGSFFGAPTNAGFGMMNDFTLEYYLPIPLKLGVQVAPLGLTTGNRPGLSSELRALVSFASSYFEAGLEPGVELHLLGPANFLLGYMVRIGSLDGLNLIVHNSYVFNTGAHPAEFSFGSISLELNIPLTQRFTLYADGGGAASWAYVTLGLKRYLRGGGGPGTVVIHGGAGLAYVSDCGKAYYSLGETQCEWAEGMGPTLALGIDARF